MKTARLLRYPSLCLLLFSTIGLLPTSCKKKSDAAPYHTLPADGLSYIRLRQGQYFVYKDSASQALDSVIVTESKFEKLRGTGSGQFISTIYYDNYSLALTKVTATGNTVWLKGFASALYTSTNFSMLSSTSNGWDDYMFRYPVDDLLAIFPNDRSINTLTVEGKQYMQIILTTGMGSASSRFYWAKNIGLIRYERGGPTRQIFTLLRNN